MIQNVRKTLIVLHVKLRPDATTAVFNILFVRALQDNLPSAPAITVDSVNPGLCLSGFLANSGIPSDSEDAKVLRKMQEEIAFTTEEGSRQLVYGAVGSLDSEEKLRGKYIQMSEVVEESDFVISEDGKIVQDKVWVSSSLFCFFEDISLI